jgi:hypothetical protein
MNVGATNLSLIGVRFTAGITFDFSGSSVTNLAAGARVLVVKNQSAFEFRYGTNLPVAGEYSGQLDNGGEQIRLVDEFGGIILDFGYDDEAPSWTLAATTALRQTGAPARFLGALQAGIPPSCLS